MNVRTLGYFVLGCVGSTVAGFGAGLPWLLPVLGAAVPYPVFLRHVRNGRPGSAWRAVLVWAVLQSAVMGGAIAVAPERAADVVARGPSYAAEMLTWIRTGDGAEGSPRRFLPVHIVHYLAFAALSLLTLGAASLVLGTWLLNYMNYYVVALVREAADPLLALGVGWPLWAVLRVIGYVATGSALAALALAWIRRRRGGESPAPGLRLLTWGFLLVVADASLKAAFAPAWRELLLRALRGSSAP